MKPEPSIPCTRARHLFLCGASSIYSSSSHPSS